jgi:hypothetical protein
MVRSILIGCSLGYEPSASYKWVESARLSGFEGSICLLTDKDENLYSAHKKYDCNIRTVNKKNLVKDLPDYRFKKFKSIAPHVARFYFLKEFLINNPYWTHIITTDVRDVLFQINPNEKLLQWKNNNLFFSGEGISYQNEDWGLQNINECFGSMDSKVLLNKEIYNVGVLAGRFDYMLSLITQIFTFSISRPIPIVDQAIFNMLISNPVYRKDSRFLSLNDDWCCNLGTYLDPRVMEKYKPFWMYEPPYRELDGYYYNNLGQKFYIVHQYDRCI